MKRDTGVGERAVRCPGPAAAGERSIREGGRGSHSNPHSPPSATGQAPCAEGRARTGTASQRSRGNTDFGARGALSGGVPDGGGRETAPHNAPTESLRGSQTEASTTGHAFPPLKKKQNHATIAAPVRWAQPRSKRSHQPKRCVAAAGDSFPQKKTKRSLHRGIRERDTLRSRHGGRRSGTTELRGRT